MEYKRGIFILSEKLPSNSGWYIGLGFSFNNNGWMLGMPVLGAVELATFNEMMFANWFISELIKGKSIPDAEDRFFVSEVSSQDQWDSVRHRMIDSSITTAVLNPCNSKDHQCPVRRLDLKAATDFNKLKEQFLKYPNLHIDINK